MSRKKVHHEEHVDETWLIPYADMLTLLLALFIVMFAMGQVDKDKLERVSNQFNIIFSGGSGIMKSDGDSAIQLHQQSAVDSNATGNSDEIEGNKMTEIKENLEKEIEKSGYSSRVNVVLNNEGLEISIQDVVLFNSGDAEVLKGISHLLLKVSTMLSSLDNSIKIVGHTDNVPIRTAKFRSNWELSAMRAINVMSFFVERGELRPERFSIQGNGQYSPKYNNSTDEGRAKNRRVEIFLIRKYPINEKTDKSTEENN